jgi:NADH-quinone oxidoreductase subunit M
MLNVLLWLPLAIGLACFLLPRAACGWASVAGSAVALGISIALIADFATGSGALQHGVDESWIPDLGIRYQLAIDGISLFLVLLTAIGWLAANLYSALQYPDRPRTYFFHLGLAQTAVFGAFLAQDLILFVLFFDLMLIPFYFLIGGWGTGDRVRATIKMIIYTLVGSLLMLIAAIATGVLSAEQTGELTYSIPALTSTPLPLGSQQWIFWFFAAAFLVKMPAFLVHGWMADAYRSCPLPVLALLSGVLSKVAAYGFLRVVLPVFPDATIQYQEIVLVLAVFSILYGSAMAFTVTNLRLIAGYSSIAQLGFITLGIFALRPDGGDGAVIQMFNHGLVILPVFFIIALLVDRYETEDVREMGGMAKNAPVLAILFMVVTLATLAMPGSSNFVGEFYILNGLFATKVALALIASIGVALAAFYALRMYQRSMHNRVAPATVSREITFREAVVVAPLVACIVAIALYPALITDRGEAAVTRAVATVATADCGKPAAENVAQSAGERGYLLTFDDGCASRYGLDNGHPEESTTDGEGGGATEEGTAEQGAGAEGELAAPESADDPDVLRCAKLATRTGTLDETLLDKCLRSAGIDPAQVEIPAVAE